MNVSVAEINSLEQDDVSYHTRTKLSKSILMQIFKSEFKSIEIMRGCRLSVMCLNTRDRSR